MFQLTLPLQPDLVDSPAPSFDPAFTRLERLQLDAESWVDHCPGWVQGDAALFEQVLASRDWDQRTRWMYDRQVAEPRISLAFHYGLDEDKIRYG